MISRFIRKRSLDWQLLTHPDNQNVGCDIRIANISKRPAFTGRLGQDVIAASVLREENYHGTKIALSFRIVFVCDSLRMIHL
jgi:hypothetical protein